MSNINVTIGDASINFTITNPISHPAFVEGDTFFRLNGSTEDTGHKYVSAENAIVFYIDGTEVGRMEKA